MKNSINLNQYLPVWLLSGYLLGIFTYRYIPNKVILVFLLTTTLYLYYKHLNSQLRLTFCQLEFYFLWSGLILACVRLSIEAKFKKDMIQKITFGPVKVMGRLNYNDKKNLLTVDRMIDSTNHHHTRSRVILVGPELPAQGELVCCEGDLIPLTDSYIPQSHDSRFDLFFKNIIGFLKINSYQSLRLERTNLAQKFMYDRITSRFSPRISSLLIAILLGDPSGLEEEFYQKMVLLGISHLMVVSAMHFGLFSGIYYFIFRYTVGLAFPSYLPIQIGAKFAALIGSCLYFILVKHNWSVIRSFTSIIISLFITLFKRNLNSFQVTCLTLLFMLCLYPYAVFELGFQLSFISVFTLILFKVNLITSTLYVTLTTAPFILYEYGYLNLQPFLASIVCIPFFSFILMPLTVLGANLYFPAWISKLLMNTIDLFFLLVDQLSSLFILPVYYYISGIGLLLILIAFFIWVLVRNRIISMFFLVLGILLARKKHYPSILIDRNLKDIFLYRNGILYTNNLESWKINGVKKFFNTNSVFTIPFKTMTGYSWDVYDISIDKHDKFKELRLRNLVIVKKWDLISHRSPVLISFKKNKILIKFNDDTIEIV